MSLLWRDIRGGMGPRVELPRRCALVRCLRFPHIHLPPPACAGGALAARRISPLATSSGTLMPTQRLSSTPPMPSLTKDLATSPFKPEHDQEQPPSPRNMG